MQNHTSKPPKMGNIPLPLAAVQQWIEADAENTPESWGYVSGLLSGILIFRPDISEELTFLVGIAAQRAHMAASQATGGKKYSLLTPAQRKMELIDVLGRMKSHSVVLGQFFSRLKTKRDAMEAMEREIENFQELVALVRLDVMREIEEMEVQQ